MRLIVGWVAPADNAITAANAGCAAVNFSSSADGDRRSRYVFSHMHTGFELKRPTGKCRCYYERLSGIVSLWIC